MTDPIEALADERADASAPQGTSARAPQPAKAAAIGPSAVSLDQHPGFRAHRLGHPPNGSIVLHPSVYNAWDYRQGNGSGLLNCAAWARRIEAEGLGGSPAGGFLRGLIHR